MQTRSISSITNNSKQSIPGNKEFIENTSLKDLSNASSDNSYSVSNSDISKSNKDDQDMINDDEVNF